MVGNNFHRTAIGYKLKVIWLSPTKYTEQLLVTRDLEGGNHIHRTAFGYKGSDLVVGLDHIYRTAIGYKKSGGNQIWVW